MAKVTRSYLGIGAQGYDYEVTRMGYGRSTVWKKNVDNSIKSNLKEIPAEEVPMIKDVTSTVEKKKIGKTKRSSVKRRKIPKFLTLVVVLDEQH